MHWYTVYEVLNKYVYKLCVICFKTEPRFFTKPNRSRTEPAVFFKTETEVQKSIPHIPMRQISIFEALQTWKGVRKK